MAGNCRGNLRFHPRWSDHLPWGRSGWSTGQITAEPCIHDTLWMHNVSIATSRCHSEMRWRGWSQELHETQRKKKEAEMPKKKKKLTSGLWNRSCICTNLCFSFDYSPRNIAFLVIASRWRKSLCHQVLHCGRQLNGHVRWCLVNIFKKHIGLQSTARIGLGGPRLSQITQSLLCTWTRHKDEKKNVLTYKHWWAIKVHSYKNEAMKMCH